MINTNPNPLLALGDSIDIERIAKKWALAHGYRGHPGGWIYSKTGTVICQGWTTFALRYMNTIAQDMAADIAKAPELQKRRAELKADRMLVRRDTARITGMMRAKARFGANRGKPTFQIVEYRSVAAQVKATIERNLESKDYVHGCENPYYRHVY